MKSKHKSSVDPVRLAELRKREADMKPTPSAEAYLTLADEYHALGLSKESDRLLQLAEAMEHNAPVQAPHAGGSGLISGKANTVIITEVIQMLSRAKVSGELLIESHPETFHLYFDQGFIINASSKAHPVGLASFQMALRVTIGTYRFLEMPLVSVPRLIDEGTEMLLLNAMHDADKETIKTNAL